MNTPLLDEFSSEELQRETVMSFIKEG